MAVPLEAFSVIVRNATLSAKYPGGPPQYRADCPNATFCADEHLSRISFMAGTDAEFFVWELAAKGLTPYMDKAAADVAFINGTEAVPPCSWLEFRRWGPATVTWLAGTSQGELAAPEGWFADRTLMFIPGNEIDERLEM